MELSIALNRYDRHVPFFNGTLTPPDGITFRALEVGESTPGRDGTNRHGRMMNGLEFDICEMSFSSFIMAVARNPDLPLVGVPTFPRRLFSLGQMYVNVDAGIEKPKDLTGREVLVMVPLVIMMFVMGVITRPFTERMSRSVNEQIVERVARVADNPGGRILAGSARTAPGVESKP